MDSKKEKIPEKTFLFRLQVYSHPH